MPNVSQNRSNRAGGILVIIMVMVVTFSLLVMALLQLGKFNAMETERQLQRTQAFWLAEAGLEEFKAILVNPVNLQPLESLGLVGTAILSGSIPGIGTYQVDVIANAANPASAIQRYTIQSAGTATVSPNLSRTNEIQASLQPFGSNGEIWITDREQTASGGNIYFATGDRIAGGGYMNDEINIWGTPEFEDLVYTADDSVNYQHPVRDPFITDTAVFLAGLLRNQPEIDFGEVVDHIGGLFHEAAITLNGDYDLTFSGTEVVTYNRTTFVTETNAIPDNGVIYVSGDAYVEGVLDARVSVAAAGALYITGDIIYQSATGNPNHSDWPDGWLPDADNLLGLFSADKVEIASGVGEVYIHAAILVLAAGDNGFTAADKYRNIGHPYINLYGMIAQYRRGVIGRVSGAGYLKNYAYDERFRSTPPPGMPFAQFNLTDWREL